MITNNIFYFINALKFLRFFTICNFVIVLQKMMTNARLLFDFWSQFTKRYLWPSGRVDNLPLNIKTWKLHKFKIWGWWRLKVNYIFWDRLWSLQLILLKGLFQQSSHLSLGKVFNYTELPLLTHTLCRPSWDTVRAHEDVQTSFF